MVVAFHSPVTKVMNLQPGELLHIWTLLVQLGFAILGGGVWYVLVVVDDFSRCSWVLFMKAKDEAFTHA
jgi:hypothetical protein